MTTAATVVRYNKDLDAAYQTVSELTERAKRCSLSDTGRWTNQNVIFTRNLQDMFPLAKAILKGARMRDECRGAHYKPDFEMPGLTATEPGERRRQAEEWIDNFHANTEKWLKTTIATCDAAGEPTITYENVDTSLITPRPRMYEMVGSEEIEKVWKEREAKKKSAESNGSAAPAKALAAV
jgi:succinate dehydrogenase / fumarate reductase flavoprotein subunit